MCALYSEGFFSECSSLKAGRITHFYLLRELWLVLKLSRILYFYTNVSFKILNIDVKYSREVYSILLHNICLTGDFPMLYSCKDWNSIIRNGFEQAFLFIFKYKELFKSVFFFHFLSSESYFLKYKKFFRVSVSWNIRKFRFLDYKWFSQGFRFLKKPSFFWENIRNFISGFPFPEI